MVRIPSTQKTSLAYNKDRQLVGVRAPAPAGSILDRAEALFGFEPGDILNQLKAAQEESTRLRKEEARVASLLTSYKARYGYPSHYEHERKVKLSVLKEARRAEYHRAGEKITESQLDEYAHAHPDYQNFLNEGLRDRRTMENLEAELTRIKGELETSKASEVYFERASRMGESLIYHSSREAGQG